MSSTDTYTPTFVDNHGPRLSASLFEQDTWNQTSTSIDRVLSVNEDKVYISSPHGSDFGSTHTSSDEDYPQVEFTEEAAVITVRLPGMKQSKIFSNPFIGTIAIREPENPAAKPDVAQLECCDPEVYASIDGSRNTVVIKAPVCDIDFRTLSGFGDVIAQVSPPGSFCGSPIPSPIISAQNSEAHAVESPSMSQCLVTNVHVDAAHMAEVLVAESPSKKDSLANYTPTGSPEQEYQLALETFYESVPFVNGSLICLEKLPGPITFPHRGGFVTTGGLPPTFKYTPAPKPTSSPQVAEASVAGLTSLPEDLVVKTPVNDVVSSPTHVEDQVEVSVVDTLVHDVEIAASATLQEKQIEVSIAGTSVSDVDVAASATHEAEQIKGSVVDTLLNDVVSSATYKGDQVEVPIAGTSVRDVDNAASATLEGEQVKSPVVDTLLNDVVSSSTHKGDQVEVPAADTPVCDIDIAAAATRKEEQVGILVVDTPVCDADVASTVAIGDSITGDGLAASLASTTTHSPTHTPLRPPVISPKIAEAKITEQISTSESLKVLEVTESVDSPIVSPKLAPKAPVVEAATQKTDLAAWYALLYKNPAYSSPRPSRAVTPTNKSSGLSPKATPKAEAVETPSPYIETATIEIPLDQLKVASVEDISGCDLSAPLAKVAPSVADDISLTTNSIADDVGTITNAVVNGADVTAEISTVITTPAQSQIISPMMPEVDVVEVTNATTAIQSPVISLKVDVVEAINATTPVQSDSEMPEVDVVEVINATSPLQSPVTSPKMPEVDVVEVINATTPVQSLIASSEMPEVEVVKVVNATTAVQSPSVSSKMPKAAIVEIINTITSMQSSDASLEHTKTDILETTTGTSSNTSIQSPIAPGHGSLVGTPIEFPTPSKLSATAAAFVCSNLGSVGTPIAQSPVASRRGSLNGVQSPTPSTRSDKSILSATTPVFVCSDMSPVDTPVFQSPTTSRRGSLDGPQSPTPSIQSNKSMLSATAPVFICSNMIPVDTTVFQSPITSRRGSLDGPQSPTLSTRSNRSMLSAIAPEFVPAATQSVAVDIHEEPLDTEVIEVKEGEPEEVQIQELMSGESNDAEVNEAKESDSDEVKANEEPYDVEVTETKEDASEDVQPKEMTSEESNGAEIIEAKDNEPEEIAEEIVSEEPLDAKVMEAKEVMSEKSDGAEFIEAKENEPEEIVSEEPHDAEITEAKEDAPEELAQDVPNADVPIITVTELSSIDEVTEDEEDGEMLVEVKPSGLENEKEKLSPLVRKILHEHEHLAELLSAAEKDEDAIVLQKDVIRYLLSKTA